MLERQPSRHDRVIGVWCVHCLFLLGKKKGGGGVCGYRPEESLTKWNNPCPRCYVPLRGSSLHAQSSVRTLG